MQALAEVILPVFLVIGFGYLAAWRGVFTEQMVDGLMRFAQGFAIPVVLFRGIAELDLGQNFDIALLLSFFIPAIACFVLGTLVARMVFGRSPEDAVAIGFACLFSNSLLLGIPIAERAFGPEGLAGNYLIIAFHSPLLYGIGITTMEVVRNRHSTRNPARLAAIVLNAMFHNPLVIGVSLGFAVNLSGLPLPGPVWGAVRMMAGAALPAALFGLGGVLFRYRPAGDAKLIALVCLLSLVVHPALVWLLGREVFALPEAGLRSAVATATMAPGANAYLFANMYGAARRVVASSVLIGTAVSMLTIWFWLQLLL